MEFVIGAASWALSKALASAKDSLTDTWTASKGIGDNLDALELELMHAQWILQDAHVRQSQCTPLIELLVRLRQLAYEAGDVLDELEYYRIQDDIDGTRHATDVHDGGGLILHARSTARNIGKHLTCCSFPSADEDPQTLVLEDPDMLANGRRMFSCAWPSTSRVLHQREQAVLTPKLKFDRVDMSTKMKTIVDKLKPICAKFSTILDKELLGATNHKLEQLHSSQEEIIKALKHSDTKLITTQGNVTNRPMTTPEFVEPELYGRDRLIQSIVDDITHGKYFASELTVLPIVGPGGIEKTTLAQKVYQEVRNHFEISIWVCVSVNFNGSRIAQEIIKMIPKVSGENENASDQELIEQRLKNKRFLLVLDDVWTCHENEWTHLIALLMKGQANGNMIIVTTRIPALANMLKTVDCSIIDVGRLGDDDFMDLFKACVFGDRQQWEDYPELHDIGGKIVKKLKGSPLAAKTVGSLLRKQLTLTHWEKVLNAPEWEQTNTYDIVPALKLSFDYLPYHLQQLFSYLAMFPEGYKFHSKELIHLWIGLDILNYDKNKRIEDIGQVYLDELVTYGFIQKDITEDGCPFYIVHDLIHELAMKVQSKECITIYSSNVRSIEIPPTVRHLSIIVDYNDVANRVSFERYKKDLGKLDRRLKIENIRTLMLFGENHGSFSPTFRELFKKAKALRAIFLSEASYSVEEMLCNFSRLVHLRYLNISSKYNEDICLPSSLCRLYHLEVIDLQGWKGQFGLTSHMSNLLKLRHFLIPEDRPQLHSNIFEVGKLKFFQELRRFKVGNKDRGFELSQLGELKEIQGSLGIYNLENVQTKEEADESELMHKEHIDKLILEWDCNRSHKSHTQEENIIEILKPHSSLLELCIRGHGGNNCPTWLCEDLSVNNLESLHLEDLSWKNFPPLGDMWYVNELGNECQGRTTNRSFKNLKRLELVKIQRLKKWTGDITCALFLRLEELVIKSCYELVELPFSNSTYYHQEREDNMIWFPKLQLLKILDCPNLLHMPPIPWTRALRSARIAQVGSDVQQLVYEKEHKYGERLQIKGKYPLSSTLWEVLALDNLTKLKLLEMERCPPLSLDLLQMLSSLKTLNISDSTDSFWMVRGDGEDYFRYHFPVECIHIKQCGVSGRELTFLLSCFPKLLKLSILDCHEITGVSVMKQKRKIATASWPSSSSNKMDSGQIEQQQQAREEEIKAAPVARGFLFLPPQLEELEISGRLELSLPSDSLNEDDEIGGTRDHPFPSSLHKLSLRGVEGMETLASLSNLSSLSELHVEMCGDLRGQGFWPLLAQGHLTKLLVCGTPNFFVASEPTWPHEQELPSNSSILQELETDDVAGVLAAPICMFLSSSLTKLNFTSDKLVERFTKEQEEALQSLNSLQELQISLCSKLKCIPARLSGLSNLKSLKINDCPAILSLPKDGLPESLQQLEIRDCSGIRSLPKSGLPSSLRVLNVRGRKSKKLRRECRRLIGTIPIVEA